MNNNTNRRGAATVEFALVCTILFLVVFAGVELSRLSMLRHTADHAAYLAARDAIVPGADADLIQGTAENHLPTIGVVSATVTVSPADITEETEEVEVTVTIPTASKADCLIDDRNPCFRCVPEAIHPLAT